MTTIDVSAAPAGSIGSDGTILSDMPCRKCGYNLRALAAVGLCPECAEPVAASIRNDLLKFSSPPWLATLARGVKIYMLGIGVISLWLIGIMIYFGHDRARAVHRNDARRRRSLDPDDLRMVVANGARPQWTR